MTITNTVTPIIANTVALELFEVRLAALNIVVPAVVMAVLRAVLMAVLLRVVMAEVMAVLEFLAVLRIGVESKSGFETIVVSMDSCFV